MCVCVCVHAGVIVHVKMSVEYSLTLCSLTWGGSCLDSGPAATHCLLPCMGAFVRPPGLGLFVTSPPDHLH